MSFKGTYSSVLDKLIFADDNKSDTLTISRSQNGSLLGNGGSVSIAGGSSTV